MISAIVVVTVVLIATVLVVNVLTSIEADVEVTFNYPSSSIHDERRVWIILERGASGSARVGNISQTVGSGAGTLSTTFPVSRIGTYLVTAGYTAGTGSVFKTEEVELTRSHDGRTVSVRLDL